MSVLKIENLHKYYADFHAVKGISLEVGEGDIFGFIGPNGAGKTTTIKCIAGLLNFEKGYIKIKDKDIKKETNKVKSFLGYIPDTPFLYDKLTGREFLFFLGSIFGMQDSEITRQIDYYSDLLEFKDYMDDRTEDYSHGMKQRIVIASAFLHNPALVLIDEPMVGLDPKMAKIVKDLFKDYVKKQEAAIFVSTHTLSLAEEICDEIGIINKGEIIYKGNLENLKMQMHKHNLEELYLEITKND